MNQEKLTKEEIKAIKSGRAYRSWKKRVAFGIGGFLAWAFLGMPLAHMNSITEVIYIIGLLISVNVELYVLVLKCWKCSECNTKLPKKSMGGVYVPFLVKNCHNCGADLTQ